MVVSRLVGRPGSASWSWLCVTPLDRAYRPESKIDRAGEQTGKFEKVCVKRAPSAANRSTFGVRTTGCP
jgi:hypothetical protein